jgi:hypothetical protein
MQRVLWILLLVEIVVLASGIGQRWYLMRRQAAVPRYLVSGITSAVAMILLIVSAMLDSESPVAITLLALGGFFAVIGLWQALDGWWRQFREASGT